MSRIFFPIFVILLFSIAPFATWAAGNDIYLVEDVFVEVSSKSPSAARNNAVASARRDAFLILLNRLGLNINTADNISDAEIAEMVRSEQIDKEKIAGNTYSAQFNIMFAKNFVDHILLQKKQKLVTKGEMLGHENHIVSSTDSTQIAEEQILIPVKNMKGKLILWEDANDWKAAIEKVLKKKAVKQMVVPAPDVDNISALNHENVESVTYTSLTPILLKYQANAANILFFNYDSIENKVIIDLVYVKKMQKKQIRLSFVNVDYLRYESLLNKVAEKTIEYIQTSQDLKKSAGANLYRLIIPVARLSDWVKIKNKLESSNLINQLNLESISKEEVKVTVSYVDNVVPIETAFSKVDLNLSQVSDNLYILRQ